MVGPAAPRRRIAFRLAIAAALLLGLAVTMLVALQRQLIYFPDPTSVRPAGEVVEGARDVTVRTSDGLELGAWLVPPAAGADLGVAVLVAPGNGGNRSDRVPLATALAQRGLAVLLMDYRGYGGNPGSPSEAGLLRDAVAAVEALEELGYPPHRTLYFGESLGSGVVAALQARRAPAGVVLRSPFPELADVGAHHYPWLPVRLVLRDRFPVVAHLRDTDVPVIVIYGDRDTVVPSRLSERVADETGSLVDRVVITGADHNDRVMFGPRVADAVSRLAREVG